MSPVKISQVIYLLTPDGQHVYGNGRGIYSLQPRQGFWKTHCINDPCFTVPETMERNRLKASAQTGVDLVWKLSDQTIQHISL